MDGRKATKHSWALEKITIKTVRTLLAQPGTDVRTPGPTAIRAWAVPYFPLLRVSAFPQASSPRFWLSLIHI